MLGALYGYEGLASAQDPDSKLRFCDFKIEALRASWNVLSAIGAPEYSIQIVPLKTWANSESPLAFVAGALVGAIVAAYVGVFGAINAANKIFNKCMSLKFLIFIYKLN